MDRMQIWIGICFVALVGTAAAQSGTVPLFSGSTYSGPSVITQSSGNVQIDTTLTLGQPSVSTSSTVTGGIYANANGQLMNNITDDNPAAVTYGYRQFVYGLGNNTNPIGVGGINVNVQDDSSVTGATKGLLYGAVITINPQISRNNIPNDDATGIILQNNGTGKATDAIYFGNGGGISGTNSQWITELSMSANSDYGILMGGTHSQYGIDLKQGTYGLGAIRLPFNSFLLGRNSANTADMQVIGLGTGNSIFIGDGSTNTIGANAPIAGPSGNAAIIRGGGGASYDLVVQSADGTQSNLTIADSGDTTIRGIVYGTTGNSIVIRGGTGATYDLVVQNNAGNQANFFVDEAGNTTARGNLSAASGSSVVYRCTAAGSLPVGALTINTASCGGTADTGLRVK